MENISSYLGWGIGGFFLIGLLIVIYFLPSIIAFKRDHHYKFIILVLNLFGISGICWLIAFVWAVFPSEKSIIDPIIGNVTGKGTRNTGDTIGAVNYGTERGYQQERDQSIDPTSSDLEKLSKLQQLRDSGTLSEDEFIKMKSKILR